MLVSPTRLVLAVVAMLAVGYWWRIGGRDRWQSLTRQRLVWGVPWATLATTVLVVGFYLFVQGGLAHWSSPLTIPFRSWSLFAPVGLLTSGVAHGSPGHLLANMPGLVVFGSIVEYVIGHTPPGSRSTSVIPAPWQKQRRLSRPRVRIPLLTVGMIAIAVLMAPFTLGWVLGYSGAVFALAGFALVHRPLAAVVGIGANEALSVVIEAVHRPIVEGTRSVGPPTRPDWAGIAFQGHLLGFVLGVLLGLGLMRWRDRRPDPVAVFGALLVFGIANSLWLLYRSPSEGVYVLYRGAGVVMVLLGTALATMATTGASPSVRASISRIVRDSLPETPSIPRLVGLRRRASSIPQWAQALVVVVLAFLAFPIVDSWSDTLGQALAVGTVVAAIYVVGKLLQWVAGGLYSRLTWSGASISQDVPSLPRPRMATSGLLGGLALLALLGGVFAPVTVSTASLANTGEITVNDYTITYAEGVTSGRALAWSEEVFGDRSSGIVVASERRAIWSSTVTPDRLAYHGRATVRVGGIGWEQVIRVERTGWAVVGNDSVYAVDLQHDGSTTRSFRSAPATADARIDGQTIAVAPTTEGFELRVRRNGTLIGTAPIPAENESTSVGSLQFVATTAGETVTIRAESDMTSVRIAERERYHGGS